MTPGGAEATRPRIFPPPDRIDNGYVIAVTMAAMTLIVPALMRALLPDFVPVLKVISFFGLCVLCLLCPTGVLIQLSRRQIVPSIPMLLCWIVSSIWATIIALALCFAERY